MYIHISSYAFHKSRVINLLPTLLKSLMENELIGF